MRPLAGGARALCFVNFAARPARVACDLGCISALGMRIGSAVRVRDLVARVELPVRSLHELVVELEAEGGSALWRIEAALQPGDISAREEILASGA